MLKVRDWCHEASWGASRSGDSRVVPVNTLGPRWFLEKPQPCSPTSHVSWRSFLLLESWLPSQRSQSSWPSLTLRARGGLNFQSHVLCAPWSELAPLCLRFLICKMVTLTVLAPQFVAVRINEIIYVKCLEECLACSMHAKHGIYCCHYGNKKSQVSFLLLSIQSLLQKLIILQFWGFHHSSRICPSASLVLLCHCGSFNSSWKSIPFGDELTLQHPAPNHAVRSFFI